MVREGQQESAERAAASAEDQAGTGAGDRDEDPDEPARTTPRRRRRPQDGPKLAALDVLDELDAYGPLTLHQLRCRLRLTASVIAETADWLHDRRLVSFALTPRRAIVVSINAADDALGADDAA